MVALRESLGLATVSLIYLLTVFLCAVWWGRGPGLGASLLSFLALNFFFTPPYRTLRVASSQDVISLLVFLLVAEMTARIAPRRVHTHHRVADPDGQPDRAGAPPKHHGDL